MTTTAERVRAWRQSVLPETISCPPWCGISDADHRQLADGCGTFLHCHWELIESTDPDRPWASTGGVQVDLAQETEADGSIGEDCDAQPYLVIDDVPFTPDDARRLIAEVQRKLDIVEGRSTC